MMLPSVELEADKCRQMQKVGCSKFPFVSPAVFASFTRSGFLWDVNAERTRPTECEQKITTLIRDLCFTFWAF